MLQGEEWGVGRFRNGSSGRGVLGKFAGGVGGGGLLLLWLGLGDFLLLLFRGFFSLL